MATLEELYTKTLTDEAERAAFTKAAPDAQALAAFLQERGCDATPDEARAFLDAKLTRTGELALEELSTVSGGNCSSGGAHCPKCSSTNTVITSSGTHADAHMCNDCGNTWSTYYGR